MNGISLDRRAFLGRITVTAGGIAVAALAPVSLLQASEASRFPACVRHDPCGDWQLDDMCAAYPPYSFHAAPVVPQSEYLMAHVEPIDSAWVS